MISNMGDVYMDEKVSAQNEIKSETLSSFRTSNYSSKRYIFPSKSTDFYTTFLVLKFSEGFLLSINKN